MCFTEGQGDYHVHCLVIFFHEFEILSADLQNFIRAQKADECECVNGMQRPSCCGSPPLMDGFLLRIVAAIGILGNVV